MPIQISVYDDRIMLWNPGQLPASWNVERLIAKHSSQPHNPDMANAFFRAGMIEAWGQGIERIIAACRAVGTSKPAFQYDQTGLWVVFTYKQLPSTPVKTPVKTPEQVLLQLAANPKLSLREVADLIDRSLRAVERASAKLVKEGRLRYIGPRKGGTWEIINK